MTPSHAICLPLGKRELIYTTNVKEILKMKNFLNFTSIVLAVVLCLGLCFFAGCNENNSDTSSNGSYVITSAIPEMIGVESSGEG